MQNESTLRADRENFNWAHPSAIVVNLNGGRFEGASDDFFTIEFLKLSGKFTLPLSEFTRRTSLVRSNMNVQHCLWATEVLPPACCAHDHWLLMALKIGIRDYSAPLLLSGTADFE